MQFYCAISPPCDSVYMNCVSVILPLFSIIPKAALVSGWLLDFWFITLVALLRLDQKVSPSPSTIWLVKMALCGA
jgi:hypothetical protein